MNILKQKKLIVKMYKKQIEQVKECALIPNNSSVFGPYMTKSYYYKKIYNNAIGMMNELNEFLNVEKLIK